MPSDVIVGRERREPMSFLRHTPKTLIGGAIGNVMEWYDFALYGFFAPVIAQLFFPADNRFVSLIATFGVFSVGFVMRPLGGVVFGFIGDRWGRAAVLRLSIVTMGLATFLLGLLPSAETLGPWAAVLLILVRLIQGLSVGGEFSGSVTYMVETAPRSRRGLAGSWANFGSLVGTLLGSALAAAITSTLSAAELVAWGWRVPFVAGGAVGILAFLYVRRLSDTPHMAHHERTHADDSPLHEALTRNRRETLLAILFASGYGVFFYIPLVYLPTYASQFGGLDDGLALRINALGILVALPFITLSGWLSDHWLRRRTLLMLAFAMTAVLGVGLMWLAASNAMGLIVAQLVFALLIAIPLGAAPAMFVELFPAADRLTGYSLAYNLGLGIAGGSAPMIATWLVSASGLVVSPGCYLSVAALLSLAALWAMPDRSREPLP